MSCVQVYVIICKQHPPSPAGRTPGFCCRGTTYTGGAGGATAAGAAMALVGKKNNHSLKAFDKKEVITACSISTNT